MPFVYLLKSQLFAKTYVGSTFDLENRLREHNLGKSTFTSRYKPWTIVYSEKFDTIGEARKREKYLKSCAGRKFLKKLINKIPR